MSNLTEDGSSYVAGIYQLERTDPVLGGVGGAANVQPTQLASRTAWLKARVLAALRMEDIEPVTGVHTIAVSDIGQVLSVHDPASASFNLPSLATFPKGNPVCIVVRDIGTADVVHLNSIDEDVIENFLNSGDGVTSYPLVQGSRVVFIATETSWVVVLKTEPAPAPIVVAGFQPGDVKFTAAPTSKAQPGFLLCAGQIVSRDTYADLFAAIGTTWGDGGGDGSDFQLPDYRDRFPRIHNNGQGLDAGRVFGSYQADAFKSHTHTIDGSLLNKPNDGGTPSQKYLKVNDGEGPADNVINAVGGDETRPVNAGINGWIKI